MTLDALPIISFAALTVVGAFIGTIKYFLHRTMQQIDHKAAAEDVNQMKQEVASLKSEIKDIKQDFLTKEDFFREQAKTDKKLDRIMDILLEIKGGSHGR